MAAPESQATLTAPESGCQASVADSTTPDYACRCRFPKATFARFQPHSSSFLDITDHGMMLHNTLENFAALTAGSTVRVTDGKRTHLLDVLDVEALYDMDWSLGVPGAEIADGKRKTGSGDQAGDIGTVVAEVVHEEAHIDNVYSWHEG